jgi:transcriptional regulator with XRE-family HTH domain
MKTIRALQQERGWTQFELALRVGVQPPAVYLWERGRRTPQAPQRRKLSAVFGRCSDEIDLAPSAAEAKDAPAAHHPRQPCADRRRGKPVPGRELVDPPVTRGQDGDPAP